MMYCISQHNIQFKYFRQLSGEFTEFLRRARFAVAKDEWLGTLLQKHGGVPDFIFPGPIETMIDLAW